MPGTYLQLPEPDLSHLHYQQGFTNTGIGCEDISGQKSGYTTRSYLLPLALCVSLLLHSILFFLNIPPAVSPIISVLPKPLKVELKVAPATPVPHQAVPQQPVSAEPIIEPPVEQVQPGEAVAREIKIDAADKQDKPRLIIPLTPEDLDALQDEAEYTLESHDTDLQQPDSEAFGGVFDPRLRNKLRSQKAAGRGRQVALSNYQLASGSSVVELGDEHCLSTLPQGRREDATNWYHTGCHGKSESERMMDRINESLR